MSSANIILYCSKKLKNGEHPIMLRIIKDRKPKYISLGLSCSKDLWDEKTNLPKKKHPLYKDLLLLIEKKKTDALKTIIEKETSDVIYSSEEVKHDLLKKKKSGTTSVIKYFDETVKRLKDSGRIGYSEVFMSTRNSLLKFNGNKDFNFNEVNYSFIVKYEEWFLSRNVKPNSIFVFMRTFKTLINYAKRDNIVFTEYNPFKDFSFTKYRRIKTKKRAISKEDIYKIVHYSPELNSSLFLSKNIFLFSYYCRGINFIDIAFLKWEDVKNKRLEYTRKKTKEFFSMALLEPAQKILDFYLKFKESEDSYIFPILNERHKTDSSKANRINKMIRRVNKDLKTIAEKTNINEHLTTYVARHTYATVLKKSGIPTSLISEMMGHDSEKTTQIYLDSFENEILDEANKSIL